jgi:hypothetical protein
MDQSTRAKVLDRLAEAIRSVTVAHPTRVAIDGPPASGKTTLADELAVVLRAQGRGVFRATIDDFLFPRTQRYPRGEYSAEGCYFDTHDYDALNRFCSIRSARAEIDASNTRYTTAPRILRCPRRSRLPPPTPCWSSTASSSCPELIDRWGSAHLRVDRTREDRGSCRDPRAPGVISS